MKVRDFFSFLEHTLTHKRVAMQKMQYIETANAAVSSPNFVDPAEIAASEAKRLENEPLGPEPSELYY